MVSALTEWLVNSYWLYKLTGQMFLCVTFSPLCSIGGLSEWSVWSPTIPWVQPTRSDILPSVGLHFPSCWDHPSMFLSGVRLPCSTSRGEEAGMVAHILHLHIQWDWGQHGQRVLCPLLPWGGCGLLLWRLVYREFMLVLYIKRMLVSFTHTHTHTHAHRWAQQEASLALLPIFLFS